MMTDGIIAYLGANASVEAIAGTSIFPGKAPQGNTWPQIVVWQVSGQHTPINAGRAGIAGERYQIDCWALTYTAAEQLAKAVVAAMDGQRNVTMGTYQVWSSDVIDERDMDAKSPQVEALQAQCKQVDVQIRHVEPGS